MLKLRPSFAALVWIAAACRIGGAAAPPDGPGGISGRVVDAAGAPVAGVKVTPYRLGKVGGRWDRFRAAADAVATDGSGAFGFGGVGDGYYMLSAEGDGFARTFHPASVEAGASSPVDVVVGPPALVVVRVEDERGRPVAGARVREMTRRGVNGECPLRPVWMRSIGVAIPPSDAEGRLKLPPLPAGEVVKLTLEHDERAPARIDALTASDDAKPVAVMKPGVVVRLHAPAGQISRATVDLRHEVFDDPSTLLFYEAEFDREGIARLVVAPGDYRWFVLHNEGAYLTPTYNAESLGRAPLRIEPGRNQDLHVEVRPKVTARGRIVDADTGKPIPGVAVLGEIDHGTPRGWADPLPYRWSLAGWGETDEQGWYAVDLAPGRARISFQGEELVADRDDQEITVAEEGTTLAPDFRARPIPKVAGVVRNPDGSPAARAVVRLRGKYMRGLQPVLTDEAGRFELRPINVPIDAETGKRVLDHHVVAFDPYGPLAASAGVRIDRPGAVEIRLEPHEPGWPLAAFASSEWTDWERGKEDKASAADAARSLRGQAPPGLDGCTWINTDGRALPFADLRGKYVLLDFWFIGCGPCHGDFASVKLVHELYRDRVQVIGVHNNSSPADAVREHVRKIGLPFAVAVDHPDGRAVARFGEHGIPDGYPDYVLISPEGKVLLDDRTIPHPMVRFYKLEILRKLLLESQPGGK